MVVLFNRGSRPVPANAIVDAELGSNLPRIPKMCDPGVAQHFPPANRSEGRIGIVHCLQQKAGHGIAAGDTNQARVELRKVKGA